MSKIQTSAPVAETVEPTVNVSQSTLNSILAEIEELKKNQVNNSEDKVAKAKEHHNDPLKARYRLRAGQPVVSAKTIFKDPAYSYVYKVDGKEVDNHYLELTLYDGTVLTGKQMVLAQAFGLNYERSEQTEFGVILKDGSEMAQVTPKRLKALESDIAKIVFNTKEFGRIEADPDFIN